MNHFFLDAVKNLRKTMLYGEIIFLRLSYENLNRTETIFLFTRLKLRTRLEFFTLNNWNALQESKIKNEPTFTQNKK